MIVVSVLLWPLWALWMLLCGALRLPPQWVHQVWPEHGGVPQVEIAQQCNLLDHRGILQSPGWARRPYWRYDRAAIAAPWYRIKEWDYYAVISQDGKYGLALTIADLGFAGQASVCWLDFNKRVCFQLSAIKPFTRGKLALSPSPDDDGVVTFRSPDLLLQFTKRGEEKTLKVEARHIPNCGTLAGCLTLTNTCRDALVIATSWKEDRRAFYYNEKVNCWRAQGRVCVNAEAYDFSPSSSFGVMDWGRGNWPYTSRWLWASASGMTSTGKAFGFNVGYGFSDRTRASENALFFDGAVHKLDRVMFHYDTADYMAPWRFTSSDGRFEMSMQPLLDRTSRTELVLVRSIQHQVFGTFSGHVVLDDGTKHRIDGLLGFAEDVFNSF